MKNILNIVENMDPEQALKDIGSTLKKLFSVMDKDAATRFFMNLLDDSGDDKMSGMVHL